MEMVEAAMRSGRVAEARAHVAAVSQARIAELSPRLAVVVAGATAMAAPDDDHRDRFQAALAMPSAGRWPFDLARIHLAYGERLRRTKSPAAARPHLEAALDSFGQLRAQPWTERAAASFAPPASTATWHGRLGPMHSPLSNARSPNSLRPDLPTSRSVNGCSCPPAPSATTSTKYFPNLASPPGPRSATRYTSKTGSNRALPQQR
jgi:hypothetical protein